MAASPLNPPLLGWLDIQILGILIVPGKKFVSTPTHHYITVFHSANYKTLFNNIEEISKLYN